MMDDLNENPEKVAEDIIKQATGLGFQTEAAVRIVQILENNHQLQKELAKFIKPQETESSISYNGDFAWRTDEKGQKHGPYCATCHSIGKGLFRLIDQKKGAWRCDKCNMAYFDDTFQEPDDEGGYTWPVM
jgi:hypothetical protein